MFGKTRAERLAEILDQPSKTGAPPESAIKDFRQSVNKTQVQVALKSGISQALVSDLEGGRKMLTPETAAKLAPVLGTTASDLQKAEQISTVRRMALKGALDPERLLAAIQNLAATLPDSTVSDNLVDSLLEVLKEALESYDATPQSEEEPTPIATKSEKPRGTRDAHGRQREKRYREED